ncbi:MAG TPA: hypothetical protein VGL21_12285, partial [Jatrophihabitantaceae bacterium]
MNDLEQSVRQTLSARVSHLTDDRLDADVAIAAPPPRHRSLRTVMLPLAAALIVAAVVIAATALSRHRARNDSAGGLYGPDWYLQGIQTETQSTVPSLVAALIRFSPDSTTSG